MEGSKNLYKYRGENNIDKMKEDIVIGTMAEWAAYKYLTEKGIKVSPPDMKIYEKRRKSYCADLISDKYRIHVKSQGVKSSNRYGLSWLGQIRDKLWNEPELDEFIVFAQVEDLEVTILGIVLAADIVENDILSKPKLEWYARTKVALYWEDVLESEINIRRL